MPTAFTPGARYHMLGGGTIAGATPLELVEALHASSMTPMRNTAAFMKDVADRCMTYDHDAYVRHETPEEFAEDLLHYEFPTAAVPDNVIGFPSSMANREGGE